uniref:AAA+ ATPase domain-containing protein n=1 Tax=Fagus sylvatica TaxID=28930 RepID=A0A2N9IYD1_FAGSY
MAYLIRHGEAVGIIGPSGTGKSTVLKIIAGLLAPDKGDVYIRGRRRVGLISDEEITGLRIGLVFQSAALFDSLTVRENVGFLLYENSSMPGDKISDLVTETLAAVGLKGVEDRLPSELSGGMKKRVALARSIIFDTTNDAVEPEGTKLPQSHFLS